VRAVLALCLTAGIAAAQAPNPNQAEADKYFEQGRDLLVNKKDAAAACEAFEKAIALDPTAPGVMLNLGLCYEMQTKYATSLYWFRKAQFAAAENRNPDGTPAPLRDHEDEAKKHTADLAGKVLVAKVDISQAPPNVRVSIDGRPVRPEDYLRLEVDRDSKIEARAPNKEPLQLPVKLTAGDTAVENIVIVMKDEIIPPMRDPGKGRRVISYIMGGGGLVLVGVSVAYGFYIKGRADAKDDPLDYDTAKDRLRYYGTGMFVGGVALIGGAVALYLTAPKPYRERREAAFVPVVTPDHVGFGYARSF
jgi:tetratricopeptide (TPR) repeat protein